MGDWESVFGAGVSAESVIDQINNSWFAEQEGIGNNEHKGIERAKKEQSTAFLGSDEVKETFIRLLRDNVRRYQDFPCDGVLLKIVYPHGREIDDIEDHYRIPVPLARILEEVTEGLRGSEGLYHKPGRKDKIALEWLVNCFESIKPGVDLRLVVHKFAAIMTQEAIHFPVETRFGYSDRETEVIAACEPAIEIIYARARGVFVQDSIVAAARQSAENAISKDWTNGASGDDSIDDMRAAVVETAVRLDPNSASLAAWYVVKAKHLCCLYGDAYYDVYWKEIGQEIVSLIEQAPVRRIKIIDLNNTSRSLGTLGYIFDK